MSLRVTSLTPYTLQLQSMQLENLSDGWSLLHNSGRELPGTPHTMHCDDVYMAAFSLCSPEHPSTVQLGSLRLKLQRIEAAGTSAAATVRGAESLQKGSVSESDHKIVPDAARACMLEERTLVHQLPRIAVCPRVVEAWFETAPSASVGLGVPVKIKVGNCSEKQLLLRVFLGAGSLGSVAGEPFKDVRLGAHEAGEAYWDVATQGAGMLSFLGTVQVNSSSADSAVDASKPSIKAGQQLQLEFSLVSSVYVT